MHFIKNGLMVLVLMGFGISCSGQEKSTDKFNLDKVYTIDKDGLITLRSDDADVTIVSTDRSDVRVEINYKLEVTGFDFGSRTKFDVKVRKDNGNLEIEQQPRDFSGLVWGSTNEEYTIRIEAPPSVSLDLNGDDENYEISNIDGRIAIDADDAAVNLTACRGDDFNFNLDDGSITMDQGRGILRIDVDDGQADIDNGNFNSIQLNSDDGDFVINTSLQNGSSYNFDMDDGDLELNITSGGGTFNIRHDNAAISADQVFRRTLDEENEVELKLPGGTAKVQVNVDDANIELRKKN